MEPVQIGAVYCTDIQCSILRYLAAKLRYLTLSSVIISIGGGVTSVVDCVSTPIALKKAKMEVSKA